MDQWSAEDEEKYRELCKRRDKSVEQLYDAVRVLKAAHLLSKNGFARLLAKHASFFRDALAPFDTRDK